MILNPNNHTSNGIEINKIVTVPELASPNNHTSNGIEINQNTLSQTLQKTNNHTSNGIEIILQLSLNVLVNLLIITPVMELK